MIIDYENKPVDINIKDIYKLRRDISAYLFNNLYDDIEGDLFQIINKYLPQIYINGHTN